MRRFLRIHDRLNYFHRKKGSLNGHFAHLIQIIWYLKRGGPKLTKIIIMKTGLVLLLLVLFSLTIDGQVLSGEWYSSDSSRVYNIYRVGEEFQATLLQSSHIGDRINGFILRHVSYNEKKKRYEGIIYAPIDGLPTTVKISFSDKNIDILKLRLHRMFFLDVDIEWKRKK